MDKKCLLYMTNPKTKKRECYETTANAKGIQFAIDELFQPAGYSDFEIVPAKKGGEA